MLLTFFDLRMAPLTQSLMMLVAFLLLSWVNASSFYDNPEQDPILPGTVTIEELERKWDFEVLLRGSAATPSEESVLSA